MSANPYVGRTRASNGWNKQLAFPSEGYVPERELPYWDTIEAKRDAAQGRKDAFGLRFTPKRSDAFGNDRRSKSPEHQARVWVQRTILSKPNTLTPRQVNTMIERATAIFASA